MTSKHTANLLVELFVEELPPKALKTLGEQFGHLLVASLIKDGLAPLEAIHVCFASPRRLAVHVQAVHRKADDTLRQNKLMPKTVGFDKDGKPTAALSKRLASIGAEGTTVAALRIGEDQVLYLDRPEQGATLLDGLQRALANAISKLPIPKVMAYQLADGWTSVNFVRPAHGLVALHGSEIVPVAALGLEAGRATHGHRFEAAADPIVLEHADDYAGTLESTGAVIASFVLRRAEIERQLQAAAAKQGLVAIDDPALLDEVTALVERPNVLLCHFESEFLEVPAECLILTMKANQKYFPLLDAQGHLTNRFLVVSNIRPEDPSRVVEGNEKVVRPRLADAKFFFDQDRKKTLASRVAGLDKVVYHNKLGTQGERVQRVRAMAKAIGEQLGGPALAEAADRAAYLAKADLLTDMVGEFPELQGTMGGYYARHDGETEDIALAIEDHYKPRFAGDALPRNLTGVVAALADKLETLAGMFGIGQAPTGDKDPFALRRHALGVVRLLIERELPLQTAWLLHVAADALKGKASAASTDIELFLRDRMTVMFRDQGYSAGEVSAVLDLGLPAEVWLVPKRLAAVRAFAALPESTSLASANKRVGNILKKVDGDVPARIDPKLLNEPAEAALNEALAAAKPKADAAFDRGDYTASLQALAALKEPVDAFFDHVMVNADDPALRANRLGLLASLHAAMNRVADLSKLAT